MEQLNMKKLILSGLILSCVSFVSNSKESNNSVTDCDVESGVLEIIVEENSNITNFFEFLLDENKEVHSEIGVLQEFKDKYTCDKDFKYCKLFNSEHFFGYKFSLNEDILSIKFSELESVSPFTLKNGLELESPVTKTMESSNLFNSNGLIYLAWGEKEIFAKLCK